MHTETHQHGSYIKLITGPCQEWEKYSSAFPEQPKEFGWCKLRES